MLMWLPKDLPLMDTESDHRKERPKSSVTARPLRYFIWKRPAAKCLWFLCAAFWGGGAIGLFVSAVGVVYENAIAGLLCSVLFPPLVFLYLAIGWARQEIDAGRIVLQPGPSPSSRSVSGFSDPMADAYDARSPLYAERIEDLHRRSH